MKQEIESLIERQLTGSYGWIADDLKELLNRQGGVSYSTGTARIGLDPRYGSGYSYCILYGPVRGSYDERPIPEFYFRLLRRFNGAKFYSIDLFGVLEDTSNHRKCLSLVAANQFWINEYCRLPKNCFHFGSRKYTSAENIGYFADPSGEIFSVRKSGEILSRWNSVEEMLRDEWEESKRIETESQERLKEVRKRALSPNDQ